MPLKAMPPSARKRDPWLKPYSFVIFNSGWGGADPPCPPPLDPRMHTKLAQRIHGLVDNA